MLLLENGSNILVNQKGGGSGKVRRIHSLFAAGTRKVRGEKTSRGLSPGKGQTLNGESKGFELLIFKLREEIQQKSDKKIGIGKRGAIRISMDHQQF